MLLIKNGRVVDPKSGFDQVADVLVDGKKVVKIADSIEENHKEGMRVEDVERQVIKMLYMNHLYKSLLQK